MIRFSPGRCGRRGGAARSSTDAVAVLAWRCLDSGAGFAGHTESAGSAEPVDSLIPFGQLRGMLLVQHHLRDGRRPLLLRELLPSIDLREGRCLWQSGSIVCDLSRPAGQMGDPVSLKPWQQTLVAWAPVLRQMLEESKDVGRTVPILPYTVAEFPAGTEILPRPTAAIEQIARREGLFWQKAWERLHVERSFVGEAALLFDTRLCDRLKPGVTWPGAVALYHDLRHVPMRHVWRPPLAASVPESLFLYQPQAYLDGWNAPSPLMQRLGMESFNLPRLTQRNAAPTPLAIAG